ncbi:MAG: pyruvate ferredoxin oxidoreductase [Prevotella sp.]|nr:pyruvate ferredoxin oxidoreductase [Prevotella sp.]
MDYKYIEQLLERYWEGESTLQEEAILRAFFNQEDVPACLMKYKSLFDCGLQKETLGDDFDARILSCIGQEEPKKAKIITIASRLKPLFKAVAIVAIILTIGNAAQAPWNYGWDNPEDEYARYRQQQVDTINILSPVQAENIIDSVINPKPEESSYIE